MVFLLQDRKIKDERLKIRKRCRIKDQRLKIKVLDEGFPGIDGLRQKINDERLRIKGKDLPFLAAKQATENNGLIFKIFRIISLFTCIIFIALNLTLFIF